jgi:cell division protein FtsZ
VNVDFADVRTVMQEGGSALMGTGIGRGENRAIEAAQQAIASPLLDNVSVSGATGVLVNITGGADLTLGEVHQINEIIHDAVGEEAEIIFGAVHEPAMQGEIRVTVIATGFDRQPSSSSVQVPVNLAPTSPVVRGAPVIPLRPPRPNGVSRVGPLEIPRRNTPTSNPPVTTDRDRSSPEQDLSDMEIPTFIRRQMD